MRERGGEGSGMGSKGWSVKLALRSLDVEKMAET
jgi:hypothetical protein